MFLLPEISKVRLEMTGCSVALGKTGILNRIILDITYLKRETVKGESILK